ncbi:MarR family transcriptional regulator [Micromonospora sp. LAH09]|uniref:MarR family winged helix-turn-helix transcriptional regulator n=1 Tax=Micromonospora cabrerizensis TaxID=2911213 RepID=UPI001EE80A40|nr:MarR family transcriptional regulator [Micromonospora cabrerizensis]MCG5471281.1 MarR family transcriptional regulator [Micromonospora cabrerizensis]
MERPADLAASIDAAAETLIAVLDSASSRHQVPPTQLRVLALICGRQETNVNGLAELLDVVPSSASRLCDRLEATGLLRRVADPRDRREVRLVPTAAALTLLGELAERRQRAVQAVLDRMPTRMQHDLLLTLLAFGRAATQSVPEQQTDTAAQTA